MKGLFEADDMSAQPDKPSDVRRVVLPSGKTIEIVYFGDRGSAAEAPVVPNKTGELHICGHCASTLVYPTAWEEASGDAWTLTLRCPECERRTEGVWSQGVVERFDEELDHGTQMIVRDLKQLTHANMQDEVERFIAALRADQIWPIDF
jgi:hypothetical protein